MEAAIDGDGDDGLDMEIVTVTVVNDDGDGEADEEKMDQEKHYSSSSCEEEAQPYEKLPSYDGKDVLCADNNLADDLVYELRTEPTNEGQEMPNEKEISEVPVAAATEAVELDTVSAHHGFLYY